MWSAARAPVERGAHDAAAARRTALCGTGPYRAALSSTALWQTSNARSTRPSTAHLAMWTHRLVCAAAVLAASCSSYAPNTPPPSGDATFDELSSEDHERHAAIVYVHLDAPPNGMSLDEGAPYLEVSTPRGDVRIATRAGQSIGDVVSALEAALLAAGNEVRVVDDSIVVVLLVDDSEVHIGSDLTDDGLVVTTGFALRD